MVRRIVFVVAAAVFLGYVTLRPIHAASQTAYQDYLYQYDQYRQQLNEFKVARTEYLKYKTLTSETTALEKTRSMMMQRNKLLKSYLHFLNEKLIEDTGLSPSDKQLYQTLIANETAFLDKHTDLIPSIGALNDAQTVSKQLESHYAILQVSVRQTIVALTMGQLAQAANRYQTTYAAARDLVNGSRMHFTPQKQGTLDRWVLQISNKLDLYKQKSDTVYQTNSALKGRSIEETDDAYRRMRREMAESRQYLAEGAAFLKELTSALRVED